MTLSPTERAAFLRAFTDLYLARTAALGRELKRRGLAASPEAQALLAARRELRARAAAAAGHPRKQSQPRRKRGVVARIFRR